MTIKVALQTGGTAVGNFYGRNSGLVAVNSDGTFSIDPRDLGDALRNGYTTVYNDTKQSTFALAPLVATVGKFVNSTTLANGTLSVAAQPDVPRGANVVVAPGSPGVTAGTLTVVYVANDGSNPQTDVVSLVGNPNSLPFTSPLSKGVLSITSATVAGLSGGTSPGIQIDSNGILGVPVPPLATSVTLIKEDTDGGNQTTLGTLTTAGLWTPHVALNGTHTYQAWYSTVAPS